MSRVTILAAICVAAGGLVACSRDVADDPGNGTDTTDAVAATAAQVDGERIQNADREPGNWMSYGRTYDEQRYSPLDKIDTASVGGLGLAWSYDLATAA